LPNPPSPGRRHLRYITHPEVVVDPATPVAEWGLSERGRDRLAVMLTRPWVAGIGRVVSSPERKALETATVLAGHHGLTVEVRPTTAELDRSATGFVPAVEHERLADACFAHPERSAAGWERAVDAQARIVAALDDLLAPEDAERGDVAVVGHGGVGTLWWCHLAGESIDRRWDQPGQGHCFTVERATRRPLHHWVRIED
jgi:broad specificity phosphatase PhoE